jgi:hypothetical protein
MKPLDVLLMWTGTCCIIFESSGYLFQVQEHANGFWATLHPVVAACVPLSAVNLV